MKQLVSILLAIIISTPNIQAEDTTGGGGQTPTPPNTVTFNLEHLVGTNTTFDLTDKTTATNGDPILDYRLSGAVPLFVTLEGDHNQTLRIQPLAGDQGIYTFSYEAQDKDGWSRDDADPSVLSTITLFIGNNPPRVSMPDINFSVGDPALSIDIPSHTTPTNGDAILDYVWLAGKLPAGLSWSGGEASPPASTLYEDAENRDTAGWTIYDDDPSGASITNVYDSDKKSRVIQLSGSATANGYSLGDASSSDWNNPAQHVISWEMKYSENFLIYIKVKTTRGNLLMTYHPSNTSSGGTGNVHHGIGSDTKDGRWHTITRDLESDLQEFQPGNHILRVNKFMIKGSGRVDNIKLYDTPHSDATGTITGTPTESGVYHISVGARDASVDDDGLGGIGVDTFTLRVFSPPVTKDITRRSITKNTGITWLLNTRNGSTGIQRTDGDEILAIQEANNTNATYLHLDTAATAGVIGKTGQVKLDKAAPPGTYSLKFRAQDKDGWSNWRQFKITVLPGTRPFAEDVDISNVQGNASSWKLNGDGGVTLTEGDKISAFHFQNKDSNIQFDTSTSGANGKYGKITLNDTTPIGTYTMEFQACDEDGCSDWRTFTINITAQSGPHTNTIYLMRTVKTDIPFNLSTKTDTTDGDSILDYRLSGTVPLFVTLEGDHNQTLRIKPVTGDRGIYTFTYQALDNDGWSTPGTIKLFIINNPPIVDVPDINGTIGHPLTISIPPYTTPTNDDPIIDYAWLSGKLPAGVSWSSGDANPPDYVVYEDAEDGKTNRWSVYDNDPSGATIDNVYDSEKRSKVIELKGDRGNNGYRLPATASQDWHDTRHIISWEMKYSEKFIIYISIKTDKGSRYLRYYSSDTIRHSPGSVRHALGSDKKDGNWHTITRDLDSDLQEFLPGEQFKEVNGFLIRGSGRLDNIRLYDDSYYDETGAFSGTPTEQGTYYISVGARDRGGVGVDTFKLHIAGPPIAKNRSFTKGKNQGLATYRLNTRGGNSGIKPTDGDKILEIQEANNTAPTHLHLDTDTDGAFGKVGVFSVDSDTPMGTYRLKFRARDKDGWSNWSVISVRITRGTPPDVFDDGNTVIQGEAIVRELNTNANDGAVRRTEGDNIEAFEIRNKDPYISFDGNLSGIHGKIGRIEVNGSVPAGIYTMEFKAMDTDGWSDWKTYTAHIIAVDHTSDICYNEPTYNSQSKCQPDPNYWYFRGGKGCKQTIKLTNKSNRSLTSVKLTIDQTPDNDIPMSDCSAPGGSSCESPAKYSWGSHNFDKGIKFVMPDFAPGANKTISIKTISSLDDNDHRAMMDGTNFYIRYRDSGTTHLSKIPFCAGEANYEEDVDSDFSLIYGGAGTAALGDMAATGDAILYVADGYTQDNDAYSGSLYEANTSYILTDPSFNHPTDSNKSNASTATLDLPSYIQGKHIKWAGLFWQGYVHEAHDAGATLGSIKTDLDSRQWNSVKIKGPGGASTAVITADTSTKDADNSTYHLLMSDSNSYRFFYSSYKNITAFVKEHLDDAGGTHDFTVGNILTTAGRDTYDSLYVPHADNGNGKWTLDSFSGGSSVGYFGGWSLIVVYDLIGSPEMITDGGNETYRNISLFNGYDFFLTAGDGNVSFTSDIRISGFKTPKYGDIDTKLLFFGGGADKTMSPDIFQIQNKSNTSSFADIHNSKNPIGNQFNSSYTIDDAEINTAKINHQGMDLDIIDVSEHMDRNQSASKIRFGVTKIQGNNGPSSGKCDQIFPQALGFSTNLYVPELCYDYDVRINDFAKLAVDTNRTFTAHMASTDQLNINIMLKNIEADFDLANSKAKIVSTMPASLSLNISNSQMSPPGTNAYIPAIAAPSPFIALGSDATSTGGTIGSGALTYAKYVFDSSGGSTFTSTFDIEVNASIQFDPDAIAIPYRFTSAGTGGTFGHMNRCKVDKTYNPVKAAFNVERGDSLFLQPVEKRYPLYTQIVGRDFDISLASYTGAPSYNTENISDAIVELELIDASGFENNGSLGYDSICQDSSNTVGTASSNPGTADLFDFAESSRISGIQFNTVFDAQTQKTALRNAAFRTWVLTKDDNGSRLIVDHGITKRDDSAAWDALYISEYKNAEDNTTGYCSDDCDSKPGDTCYQCLKRYFAVPSCSRDNFAIRPESYHIVIIDNNETNGSTPGIALTTNNPADSDYNANISLAAQYQYAIEANATIFNQLSSSAIGYYNFSFISDSNLTNADILSSALPVGAVLEYNGIPGAPNPTHRLYDFRFENGRLTFDTKLQHDDVGPYDLWIRDANWTEVDQNSYPYKTRFGACTAGSADPACNDCKKGSTRSDSTAISNKAGTVVGCVIDSDISDGTLHINDYEKIPLDIEPWEFDLSSVTMTPSGNADTPPYTAPASPSNYIFMHDINTVDTNKIKAMSASIEGNMTAKGKLGTATRNFFATYYAKKVDLIIGRETLASTSDGNLTTDTMKDSCGNPIGFTQSLIRKDGTIDTPSGTDNNTTLKRSDFAIPGATAEVHLYSNFIRSNCSPSNPFTLLYKELNASSSASSSFANLGIHTPRGQKDMNNSVTYYYAKVTPQEELYNDIYGNSVITPLSVDIYCYDPVDPTVCAKKFGLHIASKGKDASPILWHHATMFDNANDGNITDLNKTQGMGVTINPQSNFLFSGGNGIRNDINVSVATVPQTVRVDILTVPWLQHTESVGCGAACTNDPADFEIHFLKKSDWAGVGKTGRTAGAPANDENTKRLNW